MPIKPINDNCWNDILRIQEEAYTDISLEDISILKTKWSSSPHTCSVYTNQKGRVLAYLLAHPWASDIPPKLNEKTPLSNSQTLFIHDLALSKEGRGKYIGTRLVQNLIDNANNQKFEKILLVSVQNTSGFWTKFGFIKLPSKNICPSYGENAQLMMLALSA